MQINYPTGQILSTAAILPATTALGFTLTGKANQWVVAALFAVSVVSLLVNIAMITRYMVNTRREE
jgi:hypothetical protein